VVDGASGRIFLSGELLKKLEQYVSDSVNVIASLCSGMNEPKTQFTIDLFGDLNGNRVGREAPGSEAR
jgi:hypothetical protein